LVFVKKAVEVIKSNKGDLLVSLGDGSPIDATKTTSKWCSESGEKTSDVLMYIAIPTTQWC
jgi:alcohol dehydrogenase class IV